MQNTIYSFFVNSAANKDDIESVLVRAGSIVTVLTVNSDSTSEAICELVKAGNVTVVFNGVALSADRGSCERALIVVTTTSTTASSAQASTGMT